MRRAGPLGDGSRSGVPISLGYGTSRGADAVSVTAPRARNLGVLVSFHGRFPTSAAFGLKESCGLVMVGNHEMTRQIHGLAAKKNRV